RLDARLSRVRRATCAGRPVRRRIAVLHARARRSVHGAGEQRRHLSRPAQHLNRRAETDATFFTAVAAAERFLRLRINGKYRDLVALVEFGNEAYVVTPFTN